MKILKYSAISLILCFIYNAPVYAQQQYHTSPPPCECKPYPEGCTEGNVFDNSVAQCFCQGRSDQFQLYSQYKKVHSKWVCVNNTWCISEDCGELNKQKKMKKSLNPSTK